METNNTLRAEKWLEYETDQGFSGEQEKDKNYEPRT